MSRDQQSFADVVGLPIADCSEVVIVPTCAGIGPPGRASDTRRSATIRGRQEERVGIPRAGSGTGSCSIDGSYSAWASNESDEHQAERLHAVVLGMVMCSVVHADVVRGGVSRGAGLFRPRARETRCRPGRSAFRSEQSQGRNNRRCSDIGTTPSRGAPGARDSKQSGCRRPFECAVEPAVEDAAARRYP